MQLKFLIARIMADLVSNSIYKVYKKTQTTAIGASD